MLKKRSLKGLLAGIMASVLACSVLLHGVPGIKDLMSLRAGAAVPEGEPRTLVFNKTLMQGKALNKTNGTLQ